MAQIEQLTVALGVNMANFQTGMKKAGGELDKFTKQADESGSKIARAFSGMSAIAMRLAPAFAAVGGALIAVAKAGDEAANNMRRMEALIATTRNTAGLTAAEIHQFARQLAADTLASTQEIERAAGKLITYNKVSGEAFTKTLKLSQDLAEIGFGSLEENANRLGKALQDPVIGVGALAEVGVSFTKQQREMIRAMTETNRAADAQKLILKAVADQVGGAGGSQSGLTAAMDLLKQRTTELMELWNEKGGIAENFATSITWVANAIDKVNEKIEKNIMDEAGIRTARALEAQARAQLEVLEVQKKIELARQQGMSEETIEREIDAVLKKKQAKLAEAEAELKAAKALEESVKWTREQTELNARNGPIINGIVNKRNEEIAGLEHLNMLFGDAASAMEKQIALKESATEVARVNWEIENGAYKDFNEQQQARLRWLAYELDLLEQKGKAIETVKNAEALAGPPTQETVNDEAKASMMDFLNWNNKSLEEQRQAAVNHEQVLTRFKQASTDQQVNIVAGGLEQMTGAMGKHSRKMFEINKIAATAQAIVNTAQGVTKALATLPPPLSFAVAATTAAAGIAQVRAIQSQQFGGGGGGVPAAVGTDGTPGAATAAEPEPARRYIKVEGIDAGQLFDSKSVRALIRQIGEELGDGVVLVT